MERQIQSQNQEEQQRHMGYKSLLGVASTDLRAQLDLGGEGSTNFPEQVKPKSTHFRATSMPRSMRTQGKGGYHHSANGTDMLRRKSNPISSSKSLSHKLMFKGPYHSTRHRARKHIEDKWSLLILNRRNFRTMPTIVRTQPRASSQI